MTKLFDVATVIGRFQGIHNAHVELLREAGEAADTVVVQVGSSFQPRTHKNPWTYSDRSALLNLVTEPLEQETGARYRICANYDSLYDDEGWVARTQMITEQFVKPGDRLAIIGHKKDADTTAYLEMFPQWVYHGISHIQQLDATQIRDIYFQKNYNPNFLRGVVPEAVISLLDVFRKSDAFDYIMEGKRVIEDRRRPYALLPYPIVAVTADAVVTCNGHILLIQRRSHPGKDLWALPGGYFDAIKDDEPLDAVFRELVEETRIDVPEKVLRGSLSDHRTFSHRNRSLLGRSITHAGRITLNGKLPKVKGSDDAKRAQWVPFNLVNKELMFDDHYDIISHYIQLPSLI